MYILCITPKCTFLCIPVLYAALQCSIASRQPINHQSYAVRGLDMTLKANTALQPAPLTFASLIEGFPSWRGITPFHPYMVTTKCFSISQHTNSELRTPGKPHRHHRNRAVRWFDQRKGGPSAIYSSPLVSTISVLENTPPIGCCTSWWYGALAGSMHTTCPYLYPYIACRISDAMRTQLSPILKIYTSIHDEIFHSHPTSHSFISIITIAVRSHSYSSTWFVQTPPTSPPSTTFL